MTDLRSAPAPPLDDSDHVRGYARAPLVVFYGDYTCPRCALAHERLRELPVRLAFRHFAIAAKHPRAVPLACAAEAAAPQGRFWEFHDSLFEDPAHTDDPHLWARREALGLDLERFEATAAARRSRRACGSRPAAACAPGSPRLRRFFFDGQIRPGIPALILIARLTG